MPMSILRGRPVAMAVACLCTILSASAQNLAPSNNAPQARSPGDRLLPLEVFINSTKGGVWTLLERNGILYAPEEAFDEWRLNRRSSAQDIQFQGQKWYALSAIPGFEARLNFAAQSIDLVFSPAAFNALRLTQEAALRPPLSPTIPAFFANYDLNYTTSHSRNGGIDSRDLGVLTEFGASGPWGLMTSSYVGRNLVTQDPNLHSSWRRLETTYTRNFLDSTSTLRLGDSSTRTGVAGRSVYFGGLQVSKNFALQPGFITRPIPTVVGVSTAPSTVELYINDALRQTSKVPAGPFSIENLPALTGAGEARVVVRDILGRETVITQPFFSNANLLEENLTDYSFELGAIRKNLGTDNSNYGAPFVSGLWRQGLSKSVTVEANGETSKSLSRVGLGSSFGLPYQMLGQSGLSASRSDVGGGGVNWLAGIERTGLRHGFSAIAQGASRGFRQLGIDTTAPLPRRQMTASYSYSSDSFGAFNVGYGSFDNYDTGRLNTVSVNYTLRLGLRNSLTLNATRLSGTTSGNSVGAFLIIPLENRITVSSGMTSRGGKTDMNINASKAIAAETGWGWRTSAGTRTGESFAEGGAYYQGIKGLFSADVNNTPSQQNVRLGMVGGAVLADGQAFATRRVEGSFAVVEVAGYGDVGVGFQGSTLTRTNADGMALLTRLLPFQRNSVRLDPTELPISAELDSIEQETVPGLRSAVKITFPVRSGRGALLKIDFDDGEPAPAGAAVGLAGDSKEFFVARRGEAFVTGLQSSNTLRLTWDGASCTLRVELPPGKAEDITRVGPLRCAGVKR